jgi:hypothetical protein
VRVPVIWAGKGLVEAVVKVLVVREDDMAADVVELVVGISAAWPWEAAGGNSRSPRASRPWKQDRRGSRCGRGSSTRGHSAAGVNRVLQDVGGLSAYVLMQSLGGTQAGGASANDEDIDLAAHPSAAIPWR